MPIPDRIVIAKCGSDTKPLPTDNIAMVRTEVKDNVLCDGCVYSLGNNNGRVTFLVSSNENRLCVKDKAPIALPEVRRISK